MRRRRSRSFRTSSFCSHRAPFCLETKLMNAPILAVSSLLGLKIFMKESNRVTKESSLFSLPHDEDSSFPPR